MSKPRVSLHQQFSEVRSEIGKRHEVYGRLVASGKMRKAEADLKIANMEAVADTLQWLSRNEDDIRAFVAERAKAREQGQ